jgi:glycosyltransferase involved in cell wall biosynthesis
VRVGLLCSTPMPPEEGISTYVLHLAAELRRLGEAPVVLTRGHGLAAREEDLDGLRVVRLPYVPLHPLHVRAQEQLCARLWKDWRLDLVHAHTPYPPRPPRELPLVVTVHTPMRADAARIPERTPRAALQRLQARVAHHHEIALIRQARIVTAVAEHVAAELPGLNGHGPARVLGNAVAEEEFAVLPEPREGAPRYVLCAGRLGFRKGLPTLLEAFAALPDADVQLWLTGQGELRARLERQARALGIAARVRFLGVVPRRELLGLYAGAAAVAVPSVYEGQPTTLLEAMAAGAPVVASAIPGIAEVAEHGRTALLVAPADPAALAAGLHTVLDDPERARRMGAAAREAILARHTWRLRAKEYLAAYEEALAHDG